MWPRLGLVLWFKDADSARHGLRSHATLVTTSKFQPNATTICSPIQQPIEAFEVLCLSPIRLGTRASKLALTQSNWVKSQLESRGHAVELVEIKTEGDIKTGPLAQIGGQGLFTKRLQIALVEKEVDLAVHSMKDLPTEDHSDLMIASVPERENTSDALICRDGIADFQSLPQDAKIGTGSVRRAAQLLHLRPDLKISDIRGNVDTRLLKLESEGFDGIILACAGLNRMGLSDRISHAFT